MHPDRFALCCQCFAQTPDLAITRVSDVTSSKLAAIAVVALLTSFSCICFFVLYVAWGFRVRGACCVFGHIYVCMHVGGGGGFWFFLIVFLLCSRCFGSVSSFVPFVCLSHVSPLILVFFFFSFFFSSLSLSLSLPSSASASDKPVKRVRPHHRLGLYLRMMQFIMSSKRVLS